MGGYSTVLNTINKTIKLKTKKEEKMKTIKKVNPMYLHELSDLQKRRKNKSYSSNKKKLNR